MKHTIVAMLAIAVLSVPFSSQAVDDGHEAGAGAAGGYCLAKHPYWQRNPGGGWTPDGYETASYPGLVAAVRRNYVLRRASPDDGRGQSCARACAQWGNQFRVQGHPLRQIINNSGTVMVIRSGLGDIGAQTRLDNGLPATITARQGTYYDPDSSDSSEADFCCCHAGPPQALPPGVSQRTR